MASSNFTVQKVCNLVRQNLNDTQKGRWTDVLLLDKFNQAMQEFYRARPDFFVGSYGVSITQQVLANPFPLEDLAVADFVDRMTAMIFESDDEYAIQQVPDRFQARFARQQ